MLQELQHYVVNKDGYHCTNKFVILTVAFATRSATVVHGGTVTTEFAKSWKVGLDHR